MKVLLSLFLGLLLLTPLTTTAFQNYTCPELVEIALNAADEACFNVGTNKACYGHSFIDAQPRPDVETLEFAAPGDEADLLEISTMRLSAMDVGTGAWGVAFMNLLAYSDFKPEDVSILVFGNVEIQNLVEPTTTLEITLVESTDLLIAPAASSEVIETVEAGQIIEAKQRLEDTSWLRVEIQDSGIVGWIPAEAVNESSHLDELTIVDAWEPYYGPMQAFYFTSGTDDAVCPQAPESGLIIQTPEGVAEVNLVINGVNIQLSATAFVQAQPGGAMTVEVISGWAEVESNGLSQTVSSGQQVSIPISENLTPVGGVSAPQTLSVNTTTLPGWGSAQSGGSFSSPGNGNANANANAHANGNGNANANTNTNANGGGNSGGNSCCAGSNPGNGNGNGNANANGNGNGNANGGGNTSDPGNGNANGNANGGGGTSDPGNGNGNANGNANGGGGASDPGNGNGNANGNGNGNANGNGN
ncbi:MAG: SH3 domain-containing protein [Anaerolineae bacterium]|nr:MAG: SH3 domain-containing protein [Anaerolineae bacterium]